MREPHLDKDKDENIHTTLPVRKVDIKVTLVKRETQNHSKKQATRLSEKTDKEANQEEKQLNLHLE